MDISRKKVQSLMVLSISVLRRSSNFMGIMLLKVKLFFFVSPIKSYQEHLPTDQKIYSWRVGTGKWATVSLRNGIMKYKLFVDHVSTKVPVYEVEYDGINILGEIKRVPAQI